MKTNSFCICGHFKIAHKLYIKFNTIYCPECAVNEMESGEDKNPFHDFKLDALKYLEQKHHE